MDKRSYVLEKEQKISSRHSFSTIFTAVCLQNFTGRIQVPCHWIFFFSIMFQDIASLRRAADDELPVMDNSTHCKAR